MNTPDEEPTEFERRTRAVLDESVTRIDGRIRSRLSQARYEALAQVAESRRFSWSNRIFVPTTVAAAAVLALVAVVVWQQKSPRSAFSVEDIELLAEGEVFELLEDDGAFYEWAVAEEADG